MSFSLHPSTFKALDANPGGTLEVFDKYVQCIKLIFELAFRIPYAPPDKEKKAREDDMKDIFEHVGAVTDSRTQLRKSAQVFKVAQTMWCKENCFLPTICRELNHLNAGQKKSAMPPNS